MKVIVLGAYTMLSIARDRGWTPGAYDLGENAELPVQRLHWGADLLNAESWIGPLGEVPKEAFRGGAFVRPLRDSKAFAGQVLGWDEFTEWRERLPNFVVERIDYVIVAPLQTIYAEYRTWVVNGLVVTASQYKQGTSVIYDANVPADILYFARGCAHIWNPAKAYVLDVASTPDGLRIVETNTINAAGWYRGNVGLVIQAIEDLER
jgi:hypothetical protein